MVRAAANRPFHSTPVGLLPCTTARIAVSTNHSTPSPSAEANRLSCP